MQRVVICLFVTLFIVFLFPVAAFCGGAWVPAPGKGDIQLGFSRKTASSSWDASGTAFPNLTTVAGSRVPAYHDFRYGYLSGELGLMRHLSARFLVTYLHGLEGPHTNLERNVGFSDAWVGLKYGVREGSWPMAVAATMRTPALYDRSGAYNRHLFDSSGKVIGVSSEWRGVLKHDYSVTYLVSHSLSNGGWMQFESGYTWREGAPADQVPFTAELGWPLRWRGAALKGTLSTVHSLGNDSLAKVDDRFRASATFNFNDASMAKVGASILVPVAHGTNVEVGYSQWVWGKSARRYREPFFSVGRSF
jgi:hypothetical protein